VKNFFFDFDSTLADTRQVAVTATQRAYQVRGLTMPAADVVASYMGVPIEVSFAKMADQPLNAEALDELFQEFRHQYALASSFHFITSGGLGSRHFQSLGSTP